MRKYSSLIRGASPLGLPHTLSRAPLRRRAPFAWLARALARGAGHLSLATLSSALLSIPANTQSASPLTGAWVLNQSLSALPREIGFNIDISADASQGAGKRGGGRGRPGAFPLSRESYEDGRRREQLTSEARNPPQRLTVVDTTASVSITNELGQSRVFHPNALQESIDLNGVPLAVTTKRDADRLSIVYSVETNREIRYVYSRSVSPPQLVVELQFLEHGNGDRARLVYEPAVVKETLAARPAATPGGSIAARASGPSAASEKHTPDEFDGRPYAELRNLKNLGILVENLSAQAAACGLNQSAIESTLANRLTDGGFAVRKNSDDDTYLYVNVITTTMPNGTCVSRYDAFLYTYATAKLSYRDQSVLAQVSLMHRGGMGSSAPGAHAALVTRGLENYVDVFIKQINDANK